jgi:hypothetical protein
MTSSSLAAVVLLCAVAAAAAFFTTAHAKTSVDGNLVAKSCAGMRRIKDWWWFDDDDKFCESRLRMDKRSAAAKHPRDLVLIAMDLAESAVDDADAKVAAVLRSGVRGHHSNGTTPTLKLRHCRLDYASVLSTIPLCRAIVNDYKNPDVAANRSQQLAPSDYFECSRRLRRDTHNCWFSLIEEDFYELMSKETLEASTRIEFVDVMLEQMLGIVINDHNPTQWL